MPSFNGWLEYFSQRDEATAELVGVRPDRVRKWVGDTAEPTKRNRSIQAGLHGAVGAAPSVIGDRSESEACHVQRLAGRRPTCSDRDLCYICIRPYIRVLEGMNPNALPVRMGSTGSNKRSQRAAHPGIERCHWNWSRLARTVMSKSQKNHIRLQSFGIAINWLG
jgi:hypothetical protein